MFGGTVSNILLLAERAPYEGPRSTRAVEDCWTPPLGGEVRVSLEGELDI